VGARLAQLGFQHVIGVDLSPAMLAEAERKHCYKKMVCNTLLLKLLSPLRRCR
jgi:predicted TPR repeat methyltransferase